MDVVGEGPSVSGAEAAVSARERHGSSARPGSRPKPLPGSPPAVANRSLPDSPAIAGPDGAPPIAGRGTGRCSGPAGAGGLRPGIVGRFPDGGVEGRAGGCSVRSSEESALG
ncbi:hypothetical protein WY02_23585 [Pseudonocardia sp. AL041005-10]|nr:hypothetical protein WY02_23585 [Pseudonocardia sp. AL041005-10]